MHGTDCELDAAQFFRAHYIQWAVGRLDPETAQELDELSPAGWENWKSMLEREHGYSAASFREQHNVLCDSFQFSAEAALSLMLKAEQRK
ncbi:MAG: hypothetical protein SFV23_14510 [Planctomycetaceae bacterium]|nr:hypothetical protein [Planctomycetaceae bacterium]